jgi:putative PEP-CTERM system TPR-repeat lipoprotein
MACAACAEDPAVASRQFMDSGNGYYDRGSYQEAIIEYRNAVQQQPTLGEAREKLADAYLKVGDPVNAYRESIRAADLMPDRADLQLRAGALLLASRQYEDAQARAQSVLAKDPKNAEALVLLGNALANMKDAEGAVARVEEAIALDPSNARAYMNMGAVQNTLGRPDEAEAAYLRAVELDPKSATALVSLAAFYASTGRNGEAEETFRRAAALDPAHPLANRALATFYIASGRSAQAEPHLKILVDAEDVAAEFVLAEVYLTTGRRGQAIDILTKRAAGDDANIARRATLRLANIEYGEGKQAAARARLDGILKTDPRHVPTLTQKGQWLAAEGQVEQAIATLKSAVAADPRAQEAHYSLGIAQLRQQDLIGAKASFTEVLKINPTSIPARLQLSRLHLVAGEAAEATQLAQGVVDQNPNTPVARQTLVRAALMNGDIPRAEAELAALRKQVTDSAPVHVLAGFIHAAKRDIPAASREFSRALELNPADPEAFEGLVGVDFANGRPADAVKRVESRLESDGSNVRLLMLASRTYLMAGQLPQAERVLRQTIELDPNRLEAYANLGQVYMKQNRLPDALREFDTVVSKRPESIPARTMGAMLAHAMNQRADAKERYRKTLEVDSSAVVAANNLAWMYAEDNENLDLALQIAQAAKAKAPDSAAVNDTLGWVYYRKGLASLAIDPLKVSVEREPRNASYHYHLGVASAAAGNTALARESLQKALSLQPNFNGAAEARKALETLE